MRAWFALCLALLAAGSAGAQTAPRAAAPAPVLRGVQPTPLPTRTPAPSAEATAQASPVSQVPLLPPPPAAPPALMSMLPVREPPACRPSCAREYYFCLSGGDGAEDCAGSLGQCVSRCNRPAG